MPREIVEHAECVAVVPVDSSGNVLLVRRYRHAAGRASRNTARASERMLLTRCGADEQETGFSPDSQAAQGFYSSPGFCTEYLHLSATDLVPNRLEAEDTTGMRGQRRPRGA
jgi:hypothetical protein